MSINPTILDRNHLVSTQNLDTIRTTYDASLLLQTKAPTSSSSLTTSPSSAATSTIDNNISTNTNTTKKSDCSRKSFLIGESEERVQALSVIMLHLCTGLQYAQGVATQ